MKKIQFTSADAVMALTLSNVEYELLKLAGPSSLVRRVIAQPRKKPLPLTSPVDGLRDDFTRLAGALRDERLYFKYEHSIDLHVTGDNLLFGGGGRSGLVLAGEEGCAFCLWSGVGSCKLERVRIDPTTGRGVPDGEIDVRDRESIETTNSGTVRIRRKRIRTDLRERIADLIEWISPLIDPVRMELIQE